MHMSNHTHVFTQDEQSIRGSPSSVLLVYTESVEYVALVNSDTSLVSEYINTTCCVAIVLEL